MAELWLKFLDDDGYEQRVRDDGDEFTIGRHSSNDLCIPNSRLSREHVRIEKIDGDFVVSDSGSTNGTRINGEDLRGEIALKSGDRLDLGGGAEIETELVLTGPSVVSSSAEDLSSPPSNGGNSEMAATMDGTGPNTAMPPPNVAVASSGGDSGIPTSIFYIAPILGVLVLLFLGGLIYFLSAPTRPSGNSIVYSGTPDGNDDPPQNKHVDEPTPTNAGGPDKTPGNLPPVNRGPTGNDAPPPTPTTNGPTTDS